MQIYILAFKDRLERASINNQKMLKLAKKMNKGDPFGSYYVVSIELEDAVLTSAMHSDGEERCTCYTFPHSHCPVHSKYGKKIARRR